MRIRILQGVSGIGFSWKPGEIVDLDQEQAAMWADGYRATWADGQPPENQEQDQGEGEGTGPYDPAGQSVKEVLAYLADVSEDEAVRVLELEEQAEQPRKGITKERDAVLARARERAAGSEQAAAEKAAEASRGGGRGGTPETR